jgi:hypothetical protein
MNTSAAGGEHFGERAEMVGRMGRIYFKTHQETPWSLVQSP